MIFSEYQTPQDASTLLPRNSLPQITRISTDQDRNALLDCQIGGKECFQLKYLGIIGRQLLAAERRGGARAVYARVEAALALAARFSARSSIVG